MDKVTVLNEKVTVLGTKLPFLKSSFLSESYRFWTRVLGHQDPFLGESYRFFRKVNESFGESQRVLGRKLTSPWVKVNESYDFFKCN